MAKKKKKRKKTNKQTNKQKHTQASKSKKQRKQRNYNKQRYKKPDTTKQKKKKKATKHSKQIPCTLLLEVLMSLSLSLMYIPSPTTLATLTIIYMIIFRNVEMYYIFNKIQF
jgi:Flp pilus assembly protein TadB